MTTFQRRHYDKIAQILGEIDIDTVLYTHGNGPKLREVIALSVAQALKENDSRFESLRFVDKVMFFFTNKFSERY